MKDDILSVVFGSFSFSSIFVSFQNVIDITWKIVGIISGVIAFICFIKSIINKWVSKYKEITKDGKVTKEECEEFSNMVKDDTSTIVNQGMDIYTNYKNKKDGE
jgi:hypothetical protein